MIFGITSFFTPLLGLLLTLSEHEEGFFNASLWIGLIFALVADVVGEKAKKAARAAKTTNAFANTGVIFARIVLITWCVLLALVLVNMILVLIHFINRS